MSPVEEIGYEIAATYSGMMRPECYEIEFKEKLSPVFESNSKDLERNDTNTNEVLTNTYHYKRPQEVEDALSWIQSRCQKEISIPKCVYTEQSCLNQASSTHNEDRESENTILEARVEDSLRAENDADIPEDSPLQFKTPNTISPSRNNSEVNSLNSFNSPKNDSERAEVKSELKIITNHVEITIEDKFLPSNDLDFESSIHHTSRCISKQKDDQVTCKNSQEANCCVENNPCTDTTQLLDSAESRSGPNDALSYNLASHDKFNSKSCNKSNSVSNMIPGEIGPTFIGNHAENECCQGDEKNVDVCIAIPELPLVSNTGEEGKTNEDGKEAPSDSLQARKSISSDGDKDDSSSIDITLSSAFGSQETTLAGNKSADKDLFVNPCSNNSYKSEEDINSHMNTDESSESSSFLKSFQPVYPLELLSNFSFENDPNVGANNSRLTPDTFDNYTHQNSFLGGDEQMLPRELNGPGENALHDESRELNDPGENALDDDSIVNEKTLPQSFREEVFERNEGIFGAKAAKVDSNQVSDDRNEETYFDDDYNHWIEATSSSFSHDKFTVYQYRMLNIASFELDERELEECLLRISQNADEDASTQYSASAYNLFSSTATTGDEILSSNVVYSNPTFLSTDSIDEDEIIEDEPEINYICDALKLIVTAPLILWQGKETPDVSYETDDRKIEESSESKTRKTNMYKAINEDTNEAVQRVASFAEMLAFTPYGVTNNIENTSNQDNDIREAIEYIASRVYHGQKISSLKFKNGSNTHDKECVEMSCSKDELADFIKTFSNDFYIGCSAMRGDKMG